MTDEAVVHLGVTSDASEAVAQVGRAFTQLEEIVRGAGDIGTTAIGANVVEGLAEMIGAADAAGPALEQLIQKLVAGEAKLSDLKGPKTLGGSIASMVEDLQRAGELVGSSGGDAIGSAINRQIESLTRIKAQAERALEGLRTASAPQAAEVQRFLNPGQITRATTLAGVAPVADPFDDRISSLKRGVANALAAGEASEEDVAAANRALYKHIIEQVQTGNARAIGDRQFTFGQGANATTERLPTFAQMFPGQGADGHADMGEEEIQQLVAAARDEAEARRTNAQMDREDAALQREADQLLTSLTRELAQIRKARADQEKAESAAYRINTRVDTTAEADARKMAGLRDQAQREMENDFAQRQSASRSTQAYTQLRDNSGLAGLADKAPGFRELGGSFVQLNNVLLKRTQTGLQEITAVEDMFRAETALAGALKREAGGHSGVTGGSVFDSFLGGAFGHGFDVGQAFDPKHALNNLASTAGVLARYGYEFRILQTGINGVTTSFHDLVQYQQSMIELGEAIKSTGAESLNLDSAFGQATNVAVTANDAYTIGTQALQAYQDELRNGVSANVIFQRSVTAVGQAMLLTGQNAQEAQANLLASTNSFGTGSAGQARINDAVVNAVHNFGGDRSQVLTGLSTSSAAGAEAGLDPEFLANIIALAQSRTGGSGSSISSSIDRIINRQNNSQFREALGQAGIADTGNLMQEIPALSEAYKGMTKSEQEAFTAALGGARSMQYLLPLLQNGASLTGAYAKSQNEAGAAAAESEKQMNSLGGQLKQIHALLSDIATNVGRSGAFTLVGIAIEVLRPALAGVNTLLTTFNSLLGEIPGGHNVAGLAVDIVLLGKAIEIFTTKMAAKHATQVADDSATEKNSALTQANNEAIIAGTEARAAADEAAAAHVGALAGETAEIDGQTAALIERNAALAGTASASLAGSIGSIEGPVVAEGRIAGIAGAGAVGVAGIGAVLSNPITWAIGGLMAVGSIKSHWDAFSKATDDSTAALTAVSNATDPTSLKNAASDLKQAASEAKKSSGGILGTFVSGGGGGLAKQDLHEASFATDEANRIAAQQSDTSNLANAAFGPGSTLAQGLQTMKDRGVDATTQLQALSLAMGAVKTSSSALEASLVHQNAQRPGATGTEANIKSLADTMAGFGAHTSSGDLHNVLFREAKDLPLEFLNNKGSFQDLKGYDPATATKAIRDQLASDHIGQTDLIPDSEVPKIVQVLIDQMNLKDAPKKTVDKIRGVLTTQIKDQLGALNLKSVQQQTGGLDNGGLKSTLDLVEPQLQANVSQANPLSLTSNVSALKLNLDSLKLVQGRSTDKKGDQYQRLLIDIQQAEAALTTAKVAEIEKIRQAAEASAGTNVAKIGSIRKDYFEREIVAAGDNENAILGILDNATKSEIKALLVYFEGIEKVKQHLLADANSVLAAVEAHAQDQGVTGQAFGNALGSQQKAQSAADSAAASVKHLKSVLASGQVTPATPGADSAAQAAEAAKEAQLAAAADPRNQVSQAQAALNVANQQLKFASSGPKNADYWNAVKAVTDAKYQLAQAEEQRSVALASSQVFPGSKLQAAASEIRSARDQLSIAERGTADWYKAQGDLTKAQVDYAAASLEFAHNERLLHIDITDPVVTAKEQVREDQGQLKSDRKLGAPKDVVAADQVKLKQDTAAAQQAVFTQQMSDQRTAFDLQEESAAQYISFLERQHNTLTKVKHKTRQQIDELNQVDQALKSMQDQFAGQFNLGDIKIPTPYEMRREVATQQAGAAYQSNQTNNVTINVTGDTNELLSVIQRVLGPATTSRVGNSRPKV